MDRFLYRPILSLQRSFIDKILTGNFHISTFDMKIPLIVKNLDKFLPEYTNIIEILREHYVVYRVLKKQVQELNLSDHPVQKAIIYNDLTINFQGGIKVAIMDLSIIIKNLNLARNKWERAYNLRQGSLLIYESINLYHKHTHTIHPILKSDFPEIYLLYLRQSIKTREFKKDYKYGSQLAQLRNNTIAHINDDIFSYCQAISRIKPTFLKKCLLESF